MSSEAKHEARSSRDTLRFVDFGGRGTPVVFLHGLCGRASEWRATALRIREKHRVFALDQRAHGKGRPGREGCPTLTKAVFVDDAISFIANVVGEPAVIVGQSFGGVVAYRVAMARPDLVRALAIVEAQAWSSETDSREVVGWLRSWPVSFSSQDAGRAWFDSQGLVGAVWCDVLEQRGDAWYPEFCIEDMIEIASEPPHDDRERWSSIAVPTLVVHGQTSSVTSASVLRAMAESLEGGRYIEMAAGHDVHLEMPAAWQNVLISFLAGLA